MEPLRKTEADGAIHLQRIQIPGVHLNDPCPGLAGKGEIGLIEDLNHGVDAVRFRLLAQGAKQGRVGRQADEAGVAAVAATCNRSKMKSFRNKGSPGADMRLRYPSVPLK